MEKQKKIALINDLSCVGRCSLTAALPIISACGFQGVPLPTGVLSAHTEFDGFVCVDFSENMPLFAEHWKKIGMRFDSICTGYLASKEQAETVKRFIIDFKTSRTLCVVDPVMGDNGKFYKRIDDSFIDEMRFLCSMADVIVPNVTEAEMLAGVECTGSPSSLDHIKDLLIKLRQLGTPTVVITGVDTGDGQIGCAIYDSPTKTSSLFATPKTTGNFPGAGDVFAASLTSALTAGKDVASAVQIAMGFTCDCVENTVKNGEAASFGLCFEPQLERLIKAVK